MERNLKEELALAHKIIAHLNMEDLTYTHITTRPSGEKYFYILQFGKMFWEANISNLIKMDFEGNILEGNEEIYNKTGYIIHSAIYKTRNDINAIFHLHTTNSIAVSVMECGLLPISQFSMPFFENISYHEYDSLALEEEKNGSRLAKDLGDKNVMLLKAHGMLTCGKNLQEAFFYTRFLEQACEVQIKVLASSTSYTVPYRKTCVKAREDMLNFEKNLGARDWAALARKIQG